MAVERRLTELIGPDGGRLHTARSRNDQVATDLRLHVGPAVRARSDPLVRGLQRALDRRSRPAHGGAILPGLHAPPARPARALRPPSARLRRDARTRRRPPRGRVLRRLPVAARIGRRDGRLATRSTAAARRGRSAARAACPRPTASTSISSRDQLTQWVSAAAQCAVTLSRLGEDLVLWTSREFGFARLGDAVSTGSSIMPQKRNPDGAELLRAKCARVTGDLTTLLGLQKGLPLGYAKDLQEDKVALFDAEDCLGEMLAVAIAMLEDLHPDAERMRAAVDDPVGLPPRDRGGRLAREARRPLPRGPPRGRGARPRGRGARRGARDAADRGVPRGAPPVRRVDLRGADAGGRRRRADLDRRNRPLEREGRDRPLESAPVETTVGALPITSAPVPRARRSRRLHRSRLDPSAPGVRTGTARAP